DRGTYWHQWLDFLLRAPPDLPAVLEAESQLSFVRATTSWQTRSDPLAVFDADYRLVRAAHGATAEWERSRLSLLLGIAPETWLRAVDALPVPNLMWEAFGSLKLRGDRDVIDRLI